MKPIEVIRKQQMEDLAAKATNSIPQTDGWDIVKHSCGFNGKLFECIWDADNKLCCPACHGYINKQNEVSNG